MKYTGRFKWIFIPLLLIFLLIAFFLIKAQFKGVKQKVSFKSDIDIEGLFLRPHSPGPHPAILILHGAGSSHQTYNKLFFKFHANAFLEKGFAVLVYTKRGSGKNDVDYSNFTYKQLVNDAHAALNFLRAQEDIDQDNIGIMGISESGWFSPELAYLDGNIKFIINRVSSPFSVKKTVIHEVKNDALLEGFSEIEVMQEIIPITNQIWQFYIDVANDPTLAEGSVRDKINNELQRVNLDPRLGKWFTFDQLAPYDSIPYAAKGQNYAYDPLPFLKKIDLPMLYVMGGNDINIPTEEVVDFLNKFKETDNKDITIKTYPRASHYLYKYGLNDGPYEGWLYVDGYLELLSGWALKQVE